MRLSAEGRTIGITPEEEAFRFFFEVEYPEDRPREFSVTFTCQVRHRALSSLRLRYAAEFEGNEALTEDFKTSHFPTKNAPAIAFPYLRASISHILLSCGYQPLIIPPINFMSFENAPYLDVDSAEAPKAKLSVRAKLKDSAAKS